MKSLKLFLISFITTLLVISCQSEELAPIDKERVAVDISMSIEQESRAAYSKDFALTFLPNDRMEIMERSLMDVTSLYYNYDTKQFLGKVYVPRGAESYEICTHIGAKSYTSEKATFEISSNQIGSAGVYLAGVWELSNFQNLSLQMAQMSSMLAFTLNPSADGVSEIILESVAGEMIAGVAEYDYETNTYSVSGTSSKISLVPVVSPTSATQYVFNILPVSLSKGAYLTIIDNKGKKMRLTLSYDAVCNFDVNKVVILPDTINQQSVGVELGTVYSSYTVDGVPTPNNNLDGSTIWINESRSFGISTHLVKEAGLYVDGVKYVGSYSADGKISALTLSSQRWSEYSIEAYIVDADGVEIRSSVKSVTVTGLPYERSFSGVSSDVLTNTWGWKHSSLLKVGNGYVDMASNSYITTPQFYVPKSINVTTIVHNTTNETDESKQIIYATPVSRDMGRTIYGGATIIANYNGTYNTEIGNSIASAKSSVIKLTNTLPCVQYSTAVDGSFAWVEYAMLISHVIINYE